MPLSGGPNVQKMKTERDTKGLIKTLCCERDHVVRMCAAEALAEIGKPAVEPLIAALRDQDAHTRMYTAVALGQIGDSRAVEPLIAALKDDSYDVRKVAIGALGEIGDSRAVEPLIAALKDNDTVVRGNAAGALGKIGDARAVEPLTAALKDEHPDVRWAATEALDRLDRRRHRLLQWIVNLFRRRG